MLAPRGHFMDRILVNWNRYSHSPMSKEELDFYCNSVWPTYALNYGERWPMYGSPDCNTILELELYCLWFEKWDKTVYV